MLLEENVKELLGKYGQEHVMKAYERLDEEGKKEMLEQIENIDYERVNKLYEQTKHAATTGADKIEPIPFVNSDELSEEEKSKYIEIGEKIIRDGKYAVVMVAGGQGTRLGHNGPKGTFDIGLESHKSLFELFCDKLKMAKNKYNVSIPWYIMTSKENNDATVAFFEQNNYFNYREGIKIFFKQGEFPMINESGKLIIGENGLIKEAADGHGGIFEAMVKNKVFSEMKEKRIEWIFTCAVDNPLAKLVDPLLLGYAVDANVKLASVSITKRAPSEKVGVFCKRNGKASVIEYTEISEEMANAVNDKGNYLYGEAHIMMNLFNIDVIESLANEKLPYHAAFKKCNYLDENGELIIAETPNAYKFEAFIFDAFDRFNDMGILRYKREECFSPVKNATGDDSPETARKAYMDYENTHID